MIPVVERLLLDYLIRREVSSLHRVLSSGIAFLLLIVKTGTLGSSVPLFSDDEVWLSRVTLIQWVLANVRHDFLLLLILVLPLVYVVVRCLFLESF